MLGFSLSNNKRLIYSTVLLASVSLVPILGHTAGGDTYNTTSNTTTNNSTTNTTSNTPTANATSTGGTGGTATASGGNGGLGGTGGTGGNATGTFQFNSDISTTQEQAKIPAASAIPSTLVTSEGTCLGSITGAGQGASFGLSFGSTKVDEDCVRRKNAALLYNFGYSQAAIELLCHNPEVAESLLAAGTACKTTKASKDILADDDELECTKHNYNGGQVVCKEKHNND